MEICGMLYILIESLVPIDSFPALDKIYCLQKILRGHTRLMIHNHFSLTPFSENEVNQYNLPRVINLFFHHGIL